MLQSNKISISLVITLLTIISCVRINNTLVASKMDYNKEEFLTFIKQELNESEDTTFSLDKSIHRIRLFNTIGYYEQLQTNPLCLKYQQLFMIKYSTDLSKKLNCKLTKGMGYYCDEHDLFIGGKLNQNSYYVITGMGNIGNVPPITMI
jgi:hypothetical protein